MSMLEADRTMTTRTMRGVRSAVGGIATLTIDPSPRLHQLREELERQELIRRAQWNRLSQDSTNNRTSSTS